jgi:hypothetical protein
MGRAPYQFHPCGGRLLGEGVCIIAVVGADVEDKTIFHQWISPKGNAFRALVGAKQHLTHKSLIDLYKYTPYKIVNCLLLRNDNNFC